MVWLWLKATWQEAPEMCTLKMYVLLDEEIEFQESIHKLIAFLSFSDLL